MQPEPKLDPSAAAYSQTNSAAGKAAASRLAAGIKRLAAKRPAAQQLDAALLGYRQDPGNIECRNALLLLLYQCVALQAHDLIARQFGALAHREDELVVRTLARIEGQQELQQAQGGAQGQLLAEYEFRPAGRAIYNYVLQKTSNIARNMQAEAYVPDAGFWSKDLITRLQASRVTPQNGQRTLHSGTQIEIPITPPDDDDDCEASIPDKLRISETPMRQSVLRVNSLARKLDALAQDMVGKTVSSIAEGESVISEIRLTVNHQRVWRAWLGLSHPDLIDLGEEELANALGVSKSKVTRDTSAAFAYMLQHPDLAALLVLMEPNRFHSSAAMAKAQDLKLHELEGALRGPQGKRFFRKCVHQWLGEHV